MHGLCHLLLAKKMFLCFVIWKFVCVTFELDCFKYERRSLTIQHSLSLSICRTSTRRSSAPSPSCTHPKHGRGASSKASSLSQNGTEKVSSMQSSLTQVARKTNSAQRLTSSSVRCKAAVSPSGSATREGSATCRRGARTSRRSPIFRPATSSASRFGKHRSFSFNTYTIEKKCQLHPAQLFLNLCICFWNFPFSFQRRSCFGL